MDCCAIFFSRSRHRAFSTIPSTVMLSRLAMLSSCFSMNAAVSVNTGSLRLSPLHHSHFSSFGLHTVMWSVPFISMNDPIYSSPLRSTSTSSRDDVGGTTTASYLPARIGSSSPRHNTSGMGFSFSKSSFS